MKLMETTAIGGIVGLIAAGVLAMLLSSCGPSTGFTIRGRFYDTYAGRYYYNGDRRGDYVFYRGNWYLYGIGTPYERDPYYDPYYDPYIYY